MCDPINLQERTSKTKVQSLNSAGLVPGIWLVRRYKEFGTICHTEVDQCEKKFACVHPIAKLFSVEIIGDFQEDVVACAVNRHVGKKGAVAIVLRYTYSWRQT